MAASRFETTQYPCASFTESAGTVLFDPQTHQICLLRFQDEYILPKGRRNIGETRPEAAVRETREETGFACGLLPVRMETRQPEAGDGIDAADEVKVVRDMKGEGVYVHG